MKKLLVSLTLLLSIGSIDAMGWFWRKKPTEEIKPAATSLELSKTEAEEVSEEPESEEIESEEIEFTLPATGALALPQSWLARQKEEAFIQALRTGDIVKVKEILAEKSIDVTKPVKSIFHAGKTPLEIAAAANVGNKEEIVKLLKDAAGIQETEVDIEVESDEPEELEQAQKTDLAASESEEATALTTERPELERLRAKFKELVTTERLTPSSEVTAEAEIEEPAIAEEVQIFTPTIHYPTTSRKLELPEFTIEFEGEKVEPVTKAARPLPTPPAPAKAKQWPSSPAPERPQVRPLPTPPAARPARVWPSTPAPQPVEVKIEVERKPRPLPTPPLKAAPRVQEVEVEVTSQVVRPLPATPARPAVRALPDLPK